MSSLFGCLLQNTNYSNLVWNEDNVVDSVIDLWRWSVYRVTVWYTGWNVSFFDIDKYSSIRTTFIMETPLPSPEITATPYIIMVEYVWMFSIEQVINDVRRVPCKNGSIWWVQLLPKVKNMSPSTYDSFCNSSVKHEETNKC